MIGRSAIAGTLSVLVLVGSALDLQAQVAVRGEKVYTMAGPPIEDGIVLVRDGKIAAVGKAADIAVPEGFRVLQGAVVTPGLIDAHTVVGLSGYYNQRHDQDQIDRSGAMQPELRAIDAYNPREDLVAWVRTFGVTSIHTGHAPGELISGQTMVVKTVADGVADAAVLVEPAAVAATLSPMATKDGDKAPGTRGKLVAMLRARLIEAQEYLRGRAKEDESARPPRDLALEVLGRVLEKETPLLVTAQRAQDIASVLRLREEFDLRIVLDGGAEAYLLADEIREAGIPVVIHPSMARTSGELENASFETAAALLRAGIPVAMQSGYESYVPKTRVVLFEAAIAAANGLSFEEALATVTAGAAQILGISDRVGSLVAGKDGDLAVFDGDPFEYTTHCIGVVIDGNVVSDIVR